MSSDPVALLRRHFGYPGFRPGQEELVRAVLSGRDALGVLPTGGGKSVCYQVPALALKGRLTLVLTPLISLMEDQVRRAVEGGLRAAHISATQDAPLRRDIMARAVDGKLDVLFVSPERLESLPFLDDLPRLDVALVAVDEAHCISQWGHDFRPSYRRIHTLRERLAAACLSAGSPAPAGVPPILALTATATPAVRADIRASLRLAHPVEVVQSFDRSNLSWTVERVERRVDRAREVHRVLRSLAGTSVVYAPTRRAVENVRDRLAGLGVRVESYHAGLPGHERSRVQAAFMDGACRVVVATNAFGMGIDKADVRSVVHTHLPGTLEGYYQEAGRAGRDGDPARCIAFHHPTDGYLARSFTDRTHPPLRRLRRLHRRLLRDGRGNGGVVRVEAERIAGHLGSGSVPDDVEPALRALERCGAVRFLDPPAGSDPPGAADPPGTADPLGGSHAQRVGVLRLADLTRADTLRRAAVAQAAAVARYAGARSCRRRVLLGYFGEDAPLACGACDVCLGPARSPSIFHP